MFISLTSSEKVLEINSQLYSPFEVEDSLIFCSFNGEIMKYSEGQLKMFTKINGQIRSIRYDAPKNTYYVTDLLRQSVIAVNSVDATES